MRRLFLLLAALHLGVPLAHAQVPVVPFPGTAPAPGLPAPSPPAPSLPAPVSRPAAPLPTQVTPAPAPAPAPGAGTNCAVPLPALHLAAADLAAGVNAYRAVTDRAGAPSEYRYWKVGPGQLAATVREVCRRGFAGYGTAPSGSLLIVLAARWPTGAAAPAVPVPPVQVAPAPVAPAPVTAPLPAAAPVAGAPEHTAPGPLADLLAGVNAARTQGRRCGGVWFPPVPPLTVDARLGAAAQEHAAAMVAQGFADHVNPRSGSTPQSRARAQGFAGQVSENIRYGTPTVDGALIWWLGSAVHCTNLMKRDWTQVGAGSAVQNAGSSFWVLVLGRE